MKNTYVKDIDGEEIFEGDIVGIYTWGVQALESDKELQEKAAGRYRIIFKHQDFRLEEIAPNWFHTPLNSSVSQYTILKVIK